MRRRAFLISFIIVIMLGLSFVSLADNMVVTSSHSSPENQDKTDSVGLLSRSFLPYSSLVSVSNNTSHLYNGNLTVMITLGLSHEGELLSFLSNLSNPSNPEYHHYMTNSQFVAKYSPSSIEYQNFTNYFSTFNGLKITKFSNRISLVVSGNSRIISKAFNTRIISYISGNAKLYGSDLTPSLPKYLSEDVAGVSGFSDRSSADISPLSIESPYTLRHNSSMKTESPTGGLITNITGRYLQTAYDETPLLNESYPTNEVIATILWAGTNSTGAAVAPFYPTEIYNYYNQTIPSYEPHSKIYGVPLNGAPPPGPSAANDTSGSNVENSVDLEMIGSTAPGSSIYNVYGLSPTNTTIDDALQSILSPSGKYKSALDNVSVISNSYGSPEYNSSSWYEGLQEAQARGITVLASSGDSGDNALSPDYQSNPSFPGDYVEFPSAMSYNDFGVTAVGGTTLTLYPNYTIENQVAWYQANIISTIISGAFIGGSTSGISHVFPEPSWQAETEANTLIKGSGRGVPDISAVANNTIVTLAPGGNTTPRNYLVEGTSISSPVTAGIIGEVDSVLHARGQSKLGFLNPSIYLLGQSLYFSGSSSHSNRLQAFYNVVHGHNNVYSAAKGYSLVTGWGSINAYNFSTYVDRNYTLIFHENGLPVNATWSISLGNSLTGNTTGKNISFNLTAGYYVYSIRTQSNCSARIMRSKVFLDYENVTVPILFLRFAEIRFNISPSSAFLAINGRQINVRNGTGTINETHGGYFINLTENAYDPYSNYMYLHLNNTYFINISLHGIHDYGYLAGSTVQNGTIVMADGMGIPVYGDIFNVSLPAGNYYLSTMNSKYAGFTSEVSIRANRTTTVTINTTRIFNPEFVNGFTNSNNTSVAFNQFPAYVNATGYYQIWVNAGTYKISAYASGYFPETLTDTFHSGTMMNLTLSQLPDQVAYYSGSFLNLTTINMTVQDLISGHGYVEISYSSATNGTAIVLLNLVNLSYETQSLLFSSSVIINGTAYANFNVYFIDNNTAVLKIENVSGSGVMFWKLVPYAKLPSKNVSEHISLVPVIERDILLIGMIAAGIVSAIYSSFHRKKKARP